MHLSGTGVWAHELRYGDPGAIADLAAELAGLGFSALWVPDVGGDLFASLDHLLASTTDVVVATGILNIWMHTAAETGAWRAGLTEADRDRVLLGIGISHAMLIDAQPGMSWDKPLATTRSYLEAMDAAGIPADGPGAWRRSARRCSSWPATAPPAPTPTWSRPSTRAWPGRSSATGRLLAVEQGVVLDTDPEPPGRPPACASRSTRRLPNYTNNWKRLGFTDDDVDERSATAWSTRSSPGVTWRPSPPGSRRTATPAPTTSASSSSAPPAALSTSPRSGHWRQRSPAPEDATTAGVPGCWMGVQRCWSAGEQLGELAVGSEQRGPPLRNELGGVAVVRVEAAAVVLEQLAGPPAWT